MVYKFSYSRRNNLQVILCFITFFLTALSDAWNKELTAPCPFISYVIFVCVPYMILKHWKQIQAPSVIFIKPTKSLQVAFSLVH